MTAHPQDLKARAEIDEAAFMAGVALFDDMLRDAERRALDDDQMAQDSMNIRAKHRDGGPLTLFALPYMERAIASPGLAAGFAAALGDYVGMLQQGLAPDNGPQFERLQFEDVWIDRTEPPPAPGNVVHLISRTGVAA